MGQSKAEKWLFRVPWTVPILFEDTGLTGDDRVTQDDRVCGQLRIHDDDHTTVASIMS